MTLPNPKPSAAVLLLSLGANRTPSGELELSLAEWSKQRETIASAFEGVGHRLRPSLWVTFSCPVCGAPGRRSNAEMAKAARKGQIVYCGHTCAIRAGNRQRGFKDKVCRSCGKPMVDPTKRTTCSVECWRERITKRGFASRKPENHAPRTCAFCNLVFIRKAMGGTGETCSRICSSRMHAFRMMGENNPGWRNGASPFDNRSIRRKHSD